MERPANTSETLVNPPIREVEELASATECTGLAPAAIQTPSEAESYAELYAIHMQKPAWKRGELGASEQAQEDERKKQEKER